MAGIFDTNEQYPGGLLTPGPTRYAAAEARKLKGSQGLLEAVGRPMAMAPNPIVGLLGNAALNAQYLTGEKSFTEQGLPSLADMTLQFLATQVPPMVRLPMQVIAYHGTPHEIEKNKFDPNRIGTGEGAQAYGYGHYTAENPAVARSYAQNSVLPDVVIGGKPLRVVAGSVEDQAKMWLEGMPFSEKDPIGRVLESLPTTPNIPNKAAVIAKLQEWKAAGATVSPGSANLYKVHIPDEAVAKMLDWDKPLSEQPDLLVALNKIVDKLPSSVKVNVASGDKVNSRLSGKDFYNRLSGTPHPLSVLGPNPPTGRPILGAAGAPGIMEYDENGQLLASGFLARTGIPGIKYLDQGSRAGGTGTHNYVVFPGNEGLLNILEKNGQPVGLMGR